MTRRHVWCAALLFAAVFSASCAGKKELTASKPTAQKTATDPAAQESATEPAAEPAASATEQSTEALLKAAGLPKVRGNVAARDFTLATLDGTNVTLSALRGSVVFLNFWATWCPPCKAEMPSMQRLYESLGGAGLAFIAVSSAEKREKVAAFVKEAGYTFPVALDENGGVSAAYGVQSIPMTLVIGRDGNVVTAVIGAFEWDSPAVIAAFRALLAEEHGA